MKRSAKKRIELTCVELLVMDHEVATGNVHLVFVALLRGVDRKELLDYELAVVVVLVRRLKAKFYADVVVLV